MTNNLRFEILGKKPKTNIYAIISNHSNETIGTIYWFPTWRRYISQMYEDIVVDASCHDEISAYLKKLMEERKHEP